MKDLAVIIINYNTKKLTLNCVSSIVKSECKLEYDIFIADNGSSDSSLSKLKSLGTKIPNLNIIDNKANLGFSKGNNRVLKKIFRKYKYSLLLNSDTLVGNKTLDKIYKFADDNKYSVTSCKLKDPDGTFQPNGGSLPNLFTIFVWLSGLDDISRPLLHLPSYQERSLKYFQKSKVGWVSGSVILINNEIFREVGFLDEKIFMYAEDVDFCMRVHKKKGSVGWTDQTFITHLGGASSKIPQFTQWKGEFNGLLYVVNKHYGQLAKSVVRILMKIFIFIRIPAFYIIGKHEYAKSYYKIFREI